MILSASSSHKIQTIQNSTRRCEHKRLSHTPGGMGGGGEGGRHTYFGREEKGGDTVCKCERRGRNNRISDVRIPKFLPGTEQGQDKNIFSVNYLPSL